MTKHPRLPAIAMLLFSLALGLAAMAATGQFHRASTLSLEDLENKIASGKADASTWEAYADALRNKKTFSSAAEAYNKALQLNPENKTLRFNAALCLGQSNQPDKFFEAIAHLSATDPKQAVDLLDRPELQSLHTDPRFLPAQKSAHSQYAD